MKVQHLLILFLGLLLVTCDSSDDGVTPEVTTYEFFDDAKMTFTMDLGFDVMTIETGTNTVFKYYFRAEEDEDIADSGYSEHIHFEVDGSLDSFSYSDDELQSLNLFIRHFCFCASNDIVFIEVGSVSGTKLSNGNWDVSIAITFQWDEFSQTDTRTVNGVFRSAPLPN